MRKLKTLFASLAVIAALSVASYLGVGPNWRALAQAAGYVLGDGTTFAGHMQVALGTTTSANSRGAGIALPPPTVGGTSCATATLSPNATDFFGEFHTSGTTTCKLTFGTAFKQRPMCIVVDETTAAVYTYDRFSINMGTTGSNDYVAYTCMAQNGG